MYTHISVVYRLCTHIYQWCIVYVHTYISGV